MAQARIRTDESGLFGGRARVDVISRRMIRIAIGSREGGSPASYLSDRPELEDRPAGHPTGLPGPQSGEIIVEHSEDRSALLISRSPATPLLRLVEPRNGRSDLRLRFEILGEQHFYGLGEGGPQFDRLGATRRLWNHQVNRGLGADIAIPVLLSQTGWGLFIDNAARGRLEPGDAGDGTYIEYLSEANSFDLYLMCGANLRQVLGEVATLLGRATMPPRWALGYMQSTRHLEGEQEVRDLARRFRETQLPCDALIFLSSYGSAHGWNRNVGHLEFDPEVFGDPGGLIGDLRDQHFRVLLHEYPVLHEDSPLFPEAERKGYLLDHAYPRLRATPERPVTYKEGQRFLDFSCPKARAWWWDHHRKLVELGIEGWWLDGGEGPPEGVHMRAGPSAVLHNRFDLLRQQAFAEGEARDRPDQRPFLLCRSGGPGMQRFGAVPWSGDINTTFPTLEAQIRSGLNLGMSGVPHWGTDIGGFYSVAPDQGELFVRWLQFGAFCSVFRGHGFVWRRHLPWAHGEEIERICRRYIELRYQLMPYTYTLAWQAHRQGLPLMRPLVLNYPDDPRTWDLGTQYLWGDDLLVAPVTKAGASHWTVYLPRGAWHDFWTHEAHQGPGGVTVEAPLDRLPLFVRAGAILPLGPIMNYAGERVIDAITLLTYPSGRSTFTLYEDDGETTGYLEGRHVLTDFACSTEPEGLYCRIGPSQGETTLLPPGRSYTFQIHAPRPPAAVVLEDGQPVRRDRDAEGAAWWHDGERFLFVRMPIGPSGVRVRW